MTTESTPPVDGGQESTETPAGEPPLVEVPAQKEPAPEPEAKPKPKTLLSAGAATMPAVPTADDGSFDPAVDLPAYRAGMDSRIRHNPP